MISKLIELLSKRDKEFLFFMVFFSIFISLIETIGVGVIMPFISVASDFSLIESNRYFNLIYNYFGFNSAINFVIVFGVGLVFFYVIRALFNYLYIYYLAKFTKGRYHIFAYRLFKNYMGHNYKDFIEKNSANIIKTIVNEANNLTFLMEQLLLMISEIFVISFIYTFLLYINWKMTLLLTIYLGINILFLKTTISPKIAKYGKLREEAQSSFYNILSSSIGNFKIFKLRGEEESIANKFAISSQNFAKANIINLSLAHLSRLFLEAIGFTLVVIIVIYLVYTNRDDISSHLSILMAFVLGLYRLMPSANRIVSSYHQILFVYKSLDIVHKELIYTPEELGDDSIEFKDKIRLKNISFSYIDGKDILKDINLDIKKGERVGIVGESGSGKSTLIDILIGLYLPNKGDIYIDDTKLDKNNLKSWRKKIGYIPQDIYLLDATIAQNVALSEKYDEQRVIKALKQANIYDFLVEHHDGLNTLTGENGVKLSGGQKQRVAIARALYHNPEVLVLDEATSALDSDTESKIMQEIYALGKDITMIIIAHRVSTLDGCDRVIKLNRGVIDE